MLLAIMLVKNRYLIIIVINVIRHTSSIQRYREGGGGREGREGGREGGRERERESPLPEAEAVFCFFD